MAFSISHYFKPALLLGLDIGHTAIRMVELSQDAGRRYRLERHGRLKLPPDIMADRQILHPGRLAEHIATLADRIGSKRKHVALALPADAVFTRRMQIPAHAGETAIEEIACAEAAAYLTLTPDQVQVDHQFSDIGDISAVAQREIVLAAARREQVEDRIAAVEAAGLHAAVLDIDLYAAHAACMRAADASRVTEQAVSALLICDAAQTQIALFDSRQMLYQRELPDGGEGLDVQQIAVAAVRALPLAIPAGMTLAHFFIGGDCPIPALERLSSLLPGVTSSLAEPDRTPLVCRVPHPFAAMTIGNAASNTGDTEDADHASAYLVACGLAMRSTPR